MASGKSSVPGVAENDLLVAIGGEVVTTAQSVEAKIIEAQAAAEAQGIEGCLKVKLMLLTKGKPREVETEVKLLESDGVRRLLCWHGLVLQETPRAVQEMGKVPSGIYIARTMLGSPAEADNIEGDFVIAIDGTPTPTLEAVLELDKKLSVLANPTPARARGGERRHVRVETADLSGRHFVATLQPDLLFWPTSELRQGPRGGAWSYTEPSA